MYLTLDFFLVANDMNVEFIWIYEFEGMTQIYPGSTRNRFFVCLCLVGVCVHVSIVRYPMFHLIQNFVPTQKFPPGKKQQIKLTIDIQISPPEVCCFRCIYCICWGPNTETSAGFPPGCPRERYRESPQENKAPSRSDRPPDGRKKTSKNGWRCLVTSSLSTRGSKSFDFSAK